MPPMGDPSLEQVLRWAAPGEILAGKYRVERTLGRGGMGVVVAARHVQLGTRVALKFLLPKVLDSPELVARFHREAQTASLIASEHVTRVLDVGSLSDGCPFIVMEYLDGSDLASMLRARGPLPIADAVDYTLQVCEALAVAHAAGIVHRDLKPANLFLVEAPDGSPHIKIVDFGISKKQGLEGDVALTQTDSAIMGSPAYIAPEQIRSQRNVDGRADIWSLGASLYEMLSGQLPFMAENLGGMLAAILSDAPIPLRSVRPEVPPGLEAAVLACLEKAVAARPANVALLAQRLGPFGSARAAASVERTMGVVARTTGGLVHAQGSVDLARAASGQRPSAAAVAPPPPAPPSFAGGTQPMGSYRRAAPSASDAEAPPPSARTSVMVAPSAAQSNAMAAPPPAASSVIAAPPPAFSPSAMAAQPSSRPSESASQPAPQRALIEPMQAPAPSDVAAQMPPQERPSPGAWAQASGQLAPPPRRSVLPWVAGLGGVASLLAIAIWLVARGSSPPAGPSEGTPAATASAAASATSTSAATPSIEPSAQASAAPAEPAPSASEVAPVVSANPAPSAKPAASGKAVGVAVAPTKPRPSGAATSDLNKLIQNRR